MTEWIPVTESLPEPYKHVWVFLDDKFVELGYMTLNISDKEHGWFVVYNYFFQITVSVKYWMPLEKPEPPQLQDV